MTTAELATALPEIVTEQVPGSKSKELLDRRDAAIPKARSRGKTGGRLHHQHMHRHLVRRPQNAARLT